MGRSAAFGPPVQKPDPAQLVQLGHAEERAVEPVDEIAEGAAPGGGGLVAVAEEDEAREPGEEVEVSAAYARDQLFQNRQIGLLQRPLAGGHLGVDGDQEDALAQRLVQVDGLDAEDRRPWL